MATYTYYGDYWSAVYKRSSDGKKFYQHFRPYITYTITEYPTYITVYVDALGLNVRDSQPCDFQPSTESYVTATLNGSTVRYDKGNVTMKWQQAGYGKSRSYGSGYTWTINKTSSDETYTLSIYGCKSPGSSTAAWAGSASGSITISVAALANITISFDPNDSSGRTMPDIETYKGITNTLPDPQWTRVGYNFYRWNTASDGSGDDYAAGSAAAFQADTTLYAIWASNYVAPVLQEVVAYRVAGVGTDPLEPEVSTASENGFFKCRYQPGENYTLNSAELMFKTAEEPHTQVGSTIALTKPPGSDYYYGYSSPSNVLSTSSAYIVQATFSLTGEDGVTRLIKDAVTFISIQLNALDLYRTEQNDDIQYNIAFNGDADETFYVNGKFDCYSDAEFMNDLSVDGDAEVKGGVTLAGETLADYVIEQGISGIWIYRKWHSGIAECWTNGRQISVAPTSMSSNGSLYVSNDMKINLPTDLFIAAPTVSFEVMQGGGMWFKATGSTTSTYIEYEMLRTNNTKAQAGYCARCIGKWK